MGLTLMGELARQRKMSILFDCQVEVDSKIIGVVDRLIQDKYERVSGIEIKPSESSDRTTIVIPYEWVEGVDEERQVLVASIRAKKG